MPRLKMEDIDQIRQIIRVAKDEGATEIVVEDSETRVSVRMPGFGAPAVIAADIAASPSSYPGAASLAGSRPSAWKPFPSPKVGIFRVVNQGQQALSAGDEFSAGQTLCFIEAMNRMFEVSADFDGVIREVCLEDGSAVQYGTILYYAEAFESCGKAGE